MIAIIDYGLGNLTSVAGAIKKIGHDAVITCDVQALSDAEKLILPGVGAFGDGMEKLRARQLIEPLTEMVQQQGKPILGICLGSQLITDESDEFGDHAGLGWVPARVHRLSPSDATLRVPHVGWNDLYRVSDSVLFEELPEQPLFYYVHSHYIEARDPNIVIGECDYGGRFVGALQHGNVYGAQFHPEKSQLDGLKLLKNFVELA
ncbi:MAG TPA: imidazole glycerol phosphate synthase subunit HisH [Sneathiellales bacterium]|nr:imidazole glycerol phosphate synthase subunit HisH [Sneathiellales bacterium]